MSHLPSLRLRFLIEKAAPALQFPVVIKWVGGLVSPSKYRKHLAKSRCLAIVRRWEIVGQSFRM